MSEGNYQGRRPFNNNRGGGRFQRRSFGPRVMHKAVCSSCGKECEVPFEPKEGRDVFCKECFIKRKNEGFEQRQTTAPQNEESSEKSSEDEESSEE